MLSLFFHLIRKETNDSGENDRHCIYILFPQEAGAVAAIAVVAAAATSQNRIALFLSEEQRTPIFLFYNVPPFAFYK